MSVFVAMSAALATIFSLEKSRKWIIREGRSGISASGAGAPMASGLRKSRGLRMVGTILTRQSMCGGDIPCGMRRVLLAALVVSLAAPAAAQAHQIRVARAGPVRRLRRPGALRRAPRAAARAAPRRSPGPTGLDYVAVALPRHQPRHALVALVAVVNRRPRGSQAPDLAQVLLRTRPSRAMRAPTVTPVDRTSSPAKPASAPAGLRPRAAGGRATCASPCAPARRRRASARARPSPRRSPPPAGGAVDPAVPRGRRAARRCVRRRPCREPVPAVPAAPRGRPRIVCPAAAPAVCPSGA